jgi:hypothetical protein
VELDLHSLLLLMRYVHLVKWEADEKAWDGSNLTGVTDDDLVDVLSYHVRAQQKLANERSPQQL